MERGRSATVPAEPRPEAANPADLPRLLAEARTVEGLDQMAVAGKINTLLIAMRAPGNEAAEAKAILAELDVSALDGLLDGHGRNCRKEAVETLLACGFPHALHVSPEDLLHARTTGQRSGRAVDSEDDAKDRSAMGRGVRSLAFAGAAVQLGAAIHSYPAAPSHATAAAAGALVAFYAGWILPRRRANEEKAKAVVAFAFGGFAGVIAAIHPGMTILTGASAATALLAIILIVRETKQREP